MSDTNPNAPASPATAAPAVPATPAPKDGATGTATDPASAPAAAPANAPSNAPAAADPASTAPVAAASGSPDDEPSETEKEILAIAREKSRLRADRDKLKDKLSQAEKLEKAQELQKAGDYVGALEVLGIDPDDFYVKSTDQIVKRDKKVVDPVEAATEAAKKVLKEAEDARERAANAKADNRWKGAVDTILDTDYDKFPALTRAIATGRVTRDDMLKYAYGCMEAKADSSPEAVAKAFEAHLAPKKKVTAPVKDGAPAPAATAAPAAAAPASGTPPSALASNAPVKPEFEDTGSVDGNYRAVMAKLGYALPAHY